MLGLCMGTQDLWVHLSSGSFSRPLFQCCPYGIPVRCVPLKPVLRNKFSSRHLSKALPQKSLVLAPVVTHPPQGSSGLLGQGGDSQVAAVAEKGSSSKQEWECTRGRGCGETRCQGSPTLLCRRCLLGFWVDFLEEWVLHLEKVQLLCMCLLYPGSLQTPGCPGNCILHADTVCGSLCAGVCRVPGAAMAASLGSPHLGLPHGTRLRADVGLPGE